MLSDLLKWLRGLSVGVKLSATLLFVVLFTAGVVNYWQERLSVNYLKAFGHELMEKELERVHEAIFRHMAAGLPLLEALEKASAGDLVVNGVFFIVSQDGWPLYSPGKEPPAAPNEDLVLDMMLKGEGLEEVRLGKTDVWVAYRRLLPRSEVLALMSEPEEVLGAYLEKIRLRGMAVAGLLAIGVGLAALALARFALINPLGKLTQQAEKAALGDLTPTYSLRGRRDELGRLSVSLDKMAAASQAMIDQARKSQARFQQLFTENRDAIVLIDEKGRLEDVNPMAVKCFGYPSREEMLKIEFTDVLFVNRKERKYYLELLDELSFVKDFPATLRRVDGSRFEGLITATRQGKKARFAMVRDVTQMRSAQRALLISEERFRRIVENAPDIIFRWSRKRGKHEYISPALQTVLGYEPRDFIDTPDLMYSIVHPRWKKEVLANWRDLVLTAGRTFLEQEFQVFTSAGEIRWVQERSVVIRDSQMQVVEVEGIITDITERKNLEREREQGRRMVESILQGLPVAVMVLDRNHKVVHWNRAMERLTGVPASEAVGTNRQWHPFYPHPRPVLGDLILDMDWDALKRYYGERGLKSSTLGGGGLECENKYKNLGGKDRYLYFLATPMLDEDCRVSGVVETLVDFSEKKSLEEELTRLSVTDELTGLYNQRSFYDGLAREIQSAERYGAKLSLLLLDLDHFKKYNDRYGHLEGDSVLKECGEAVSGQVRSVDIVCRYGGEEFVVLMPQTGMAESKVAAKRINRAVGRLRFLPKLSDESTEEAGITVSVGVAQYEPGMEMRELVRRADQAMYFAKQEGRNRVAVYLADGRVEVAEAD